MAMVNVVSQQPIGGCVAQDDWIGPMVSGRLAFCCRTHQKQSYKTSKN